MIAGLTGYITKGHLRAPLEATAWQTREVVEAMNSDAGVDLSTLKVDGGMTANNLLMQCIADVLDVPVVRPLVAETVSLGAVRRRRGGRVLARRRVAAGQLAQGGRVVPGDGRRDAREGLPQVAQGGPAHALTGSTTTTSDRLDTAAARST